MNMTSIKIAIDGTSGSGKSTIANAVSKKMKIEYINTGIIYRAATYILIKKNIIDNEQESFDFLSKINFEYINSKLVKINNKEISTDKLFDNSLSTQIYKVANSKILRPLIVKVLQDIYLKFDSVIMEGRDITSVIMSKSKNKFYVDAPSKIRASRRIEQLKLNPNTLNELINEIEERDKYDKNRSLGPLLKTEDSIFINTEKMSIKESVDFIIRNLK